MKKEYKVTTKMPPIVETDFVDSELNLFDQNNPDINLFNLVDDENIRLSGSKLNIYKFFRDSNYDEVYLEARNKVISKTPIEVYGFYEPKLLEENLSEFGIELTDDQMFSFNKSYVERKLSRSLHPGDVIEPLFQDRKYEVFEVQEESFEIYRVYHLICHCRLLRDSQDVQDSPRVDAESIDTLDGYGGTP